MNSKLGLFYGKSNETTSVNNTNNKSTLDARTKTLSASKESFNSSSLSSSQSESSSSGHASMSRSSSIYSLDANLQQQQPQNFKSTMKANKSKLKPVPKTPTIVSERSNHAHLDDKIYDEIKLCFMNLTSLGERSKLLNLVPEDVAQNQISDWTVNQNNALKSSFDRTTTTIVNNKKHLNQFKQNVFNKQQQQQQLQNMDGSKKSLNNYYRYFNDWRSHLIYYKQIKGQSLCDMVKTAYRPLPGKNLATPQQQQQQQQQQQSPMKQTPVEDDSSTLGQTAQTPSDQRSSPSMIDVNSLLTDFSQKPPTTAATNYRSITNIDFKIDFSNRKSNSDYQQQQVPNEKFIPYIKGSRAGGGVLRVQPKCGKNVNNLSSGLRKYKRTIMSRASSDDPISKPRNSGGGGGGGGVVASSYHRVNENVYQQLKSDSLNASLSYKNSQRQLNLSKSLLRNNTLNSSGSSSSKTSSQNGPKNEMENFCSQTSLNQTDITNLLAKTSLLEEDLTSFQKLTSRLREQHKQLILQQRMLRKESELTRKFSSIFNDTDDSNSVATNNTFGSNNKHPRDQKQSSKQTVGPNKISPFSPSSSNTNVSKFINLINHRIKISN